MNVLNSEDCDNFCRLVIENKPEKICLKENNLFPSKISAKFSYVFYNNNVCRNYIFHDCIILLNNNRISFYINSKQFSINLVSDDCRFFSNSYKYK